MGFAAASMGLCAALVGCASGSTEAAAEPMKPKAKVDAPSGFKGPAPTGIGAPKILSGGGQDRAGTH